MDKPSYYTNKKLSADSISLELKKSRERETRLENALLETFPVNLYRQVKELPEVYNDDRKVINHYVDHGIKELNFKEIIQQNIN